MQHSRIEVTDFEVIGPAAALTDEELLGYAAPGAEPVNRIGSTAVPVRVYEPEAAPWATLVWAHGGSFVHGALDWPEADWVARRFAEAGIRVHSVDYALASDTVKAPAPANDVTAVITRVAAHEAATGLPAPPLVVGGASAGAHLAVLAAHACTGVHRIARRAAPGPNLAALLLLYPTLHRVQRADPALAARTAQLPAQRRFGAERIAEMYAFHLGTDAAAGADAGAEADDPVADGLVAGELPREALATLPPTVIVNADADDLRASAEQFAEQLADAGVPVRASIQPGTVHGYANRPEESEQTREDAVATIATFVAALREIVTG